MPHEDLAGYAEGLARLLAEERRDRRRAEDGRRDAAFLIEAADVLAQTMDDYASLLASIARLAVPRLADWCLLRLVRDRTEATVALAHADPEGEALLAPLDLGSLDVPARSTGHAKVLVERDEACAERFLRRFPGVMGARRARAIEAVRAAGMTSYLIVPLEAHGRALGALVLVAASSAPFDPQRVALAEAFGAHSALALDNARRYRDAERAARTREDFLMVASHELRTPLASLQIAVQALLRRARSAGTDERPPPWSVPLLGAVERSVVRLGALVDDLVDFSYLAANPPVPLTEEIDLRDVMAEVVEQSAELFGRAHCEVRWSASGSTEGSWDRRWLVQILTHLLSNAARHGRGAPIDARLEGHGDAVEIVVRDHGSGIPANEHDLIFERFACVTPAEHAPGGLGLGLWLVRRMVEGLGGTVAVDSTPGHGATFTIALPRRARGSAPARRSASAG